MNELRAKKEAWMGVRRGGKYTGTARGIRHEFRVTWRTKQVKEGDREAMEWHTYIYTDRGPLREWLHKIGRADSPMYPCGEAAQNAAHIMTCKGVVEGEKRSAEDMEFCRAVFNFLWDKTEEEE